MDTTNRLTRLTLFTLAIALAVARADAKPAAKDPGDEFARGEAAFDAQQYLEAHDDLKDFVDASLGDPRLQEAKDMLVKAWVAAADQAWEAADFDGAFDLWSTYTTRYTGQPNIPSLASVPASNGSTLLKSLLTEKKYRAAIRLATAYSQHFPDAQPLADDDTLKSLRLSLLKDAVEARVDPERLSDQVDDALANGVDPDDLEHAKIMIWPIRLACCQTLIDKNDFGTATADASKWIIDDSSPAIKDKLRSLLERAAVARAVAMEGFGNVPMFQDAVEALAKVARTQATKAQVVDFQESLKRMQADAQPAQVLKSDDPLEGDGKWQDNGSGSSIDGTLTLGGPDHKTAAITASPGFVLTGGQINIDTGSSLTLQGTPQQPVIFRNVRIGGQMGASVIAKNAIFEHCTFFKFGGWFSHYSSKWDMEDCLLVESKFSSLNATDYGIRLVGCAMTDCTVPARVLCKSPPDDASKTYRDKWNQVMEDCFIRCHIAPSFSWTTQTCYFERCTPDGRDAWHSIGPLRISCGVPEEEADFVVELNALTTNDPGAPITYTAVPVNHVNSRALPALRFVGDTNSGKPD